MTSPEEPNLHLIAPAQTRPEATVNSEPPLVGDPEKRALELKKLRYETRKIKQELREAGRPYLFRNPQLLTALIATMGALIALLISAKTNYFQTMKNQADLTRQQADFTKADAERTKSDSERTKADADKLTAAAKQEQIDAQQQRTDAQAISAKAALLTTEAHAQSVTAAAEIATAKSQVAQAATTIAHEVFKRSRIPEYVYEQRTQFAGLVLNDTPDTLDWLNEAPVRQMEVRLSLSTPKSDATLLKSVPATLQDLTLDSYSSAVDLRDLRCLPHLQQLTLNTAYGMRTRVLGLASATNLRSLAIKSYVETIDGLDEIQSLQHLSQLSVRANGPLKLSAPVLAHLTSILLSARPIDRAITNEDIRVLSAAPNLRVLRIAGTTDADLLTQIRATLPALTTLVLPNSAPDFPNPYTFPDIRKLHLYLQPKDLNPAIFQAFPNVTSLSLGMQGPWTAAQYVQLLTLVQTAYPNLLFLAFDGSSLNVKTGGLVFPTMPKLETLSFSVPVFTFLAQDAAFRVTLTASALPALRSLTLNSQNLHPGDLKALPKTRFLLVTHADETTLTELEGREFTLSGLGLVFEGRDLNQDRARERFVRIVESAQPESLILDEKAERWFTHLPLAVHNLAFINGYNGGLMSPSSWDDEFFSSIPAPFGGADTLANGLPLRRVATTPPTQPPNATGSAAPPAPPQTPASGVKTPQQIFEQLQKLQRQKPPAPPH